MYTVGLDVDTILVSNSLVIGLLSFMLYAGKQRLKIDPFIYYQALIKGRILFILQSQSAGNLYSSTEVLKVPKQISDHRKPHRKYLDNKEFGYYLTGLIEGDGYFGPSSLEIILHEKDISLAYYLRNQLGYGLIYKIKDKKAIKFVIKKKEGLKKILNLTNGKYIAPFKLIQLSKLNWVKQSNIKLLPSTNSINLLTPWLAGFIDADGSLGIFLAKSSTHSQKVSVRLEIKISQKNNNILLLLKSLFKSHLYKDKNNIFRWKITGQSNLIKIIDYLDSYPLQSYKYLQYFIFRRTFKLIDKKEHQTKIGLNKIKKFKLLLSQIYKGILRD